MRILRSCLSFVTALSIWEAAGNVLFAAAEFKFIGDAEDRSFQVSYGEDLLINCSTNIPNTAVFLYRKLYYEPSGSVWRPLLPKANKIIRNGQVYIVKNFDSNDDGYYWCNATNTRGRTINFNNPSYTILVDKQRILNSIQLNPKSAMTVVGSSVYFTCSAAYESNLQWFKALNNVTNVAVLKDLVREELTNDLHKRSLHLIIKNATVKDSGSYQCLLTYKGKESQREARLTVLDYEAPVIKSYSGQYTGVVEVRNSKKTTINCTVQGYPLPTIQWYKNGREILASHCNDTKANPCKTGTKYLARLSHLPNSKTVTSNLTIIGSIFPDDHGTYICMAKNTKGHATVKIFVNIPVPPKISNQRHQVITVVLGTPINVTCSATGNPLPEVVWTRTDDPNRKVLSSGQGKALLKVKDVQEKDLGNYTCNATNTIMSVTALLTVKDSKEEKVLTIVQKEMPRSIVIGIICGSVVFTLIVVIICFILYRRQQKQTKEYKLLYFMKMGNTNYVIDPDRSLLEQCNNLPYDLDWEFPEERLILGEPLGSGAFGQVLKAEAIGMPAFKPRDKAAEARRLRSKLRSSRRRCKDEQNSSVTAKQTVAVKTLLDEASESDYKDLASELKILIHLGEHKNIVNVLGACTRGRRLLMIIEYAPHGDLLSFLRTRRDIYDANWVKTSNNPDQEFTLVDLGKTAYQISRGMEFLASKKCVHRDLAARNVLVGENYVMKISDFGLARDIYQNDIYVKTTNGLLPVRWMALESLFDRVYTEKSDVWSFGIVLWEILTLGGCPYPSVPLEGLIDFLNNGNRMERPSHCPAEMYDIMRDCWRKIPDQRPTFAELTAGIKRVIEKNAPKGNPEACLEAVHEPMRASNEYLTSAESLPSATKTSLGNQATKAPNTKSDDSSKNSTASVNGIITEPEVNGNASFFQTGKKRRKGEKKPLLPQSLFSSSKPNYINQHESAV